MGVRQIINGAFIANKAVNWLKKCKREGVLPKLDFQKACDTITWESLDLMLLEMGFGPKWRQWIRVCLNTTSISILFNGSPCKPFKMGKGLRQGDPLSPFLFVIMAEVLNKMLKYAGNLGLFKGVAVGAKLVTLTHLQFADDTLVFCETNEHYLSNIEKILLRFQAFSRLTVISQSLG